MDWQYLFVTSYGGIAHSVSAQHRVLRYDVSRLLTLSEMRTAIDAGFAFFENLPSDELGAYVCCVANGDIELPTVQHFAMAVQALLRARSFKVLGVVICGANDSVKMILRLMRKIYTFRSTIHMCDTVEQSERIFTHRSST